MGDGTVGESEHRFRCSGVVIVRACSRTRTTWTSRSSRSTSTSSSSRSDETETRAGLILPASAARPPCRTGIVTAVGTDVNGVEPGDKVLYPREAGYDVRLGGIEVKVLKRGELIARIHD